MRRQEHLTTQSINYVFRFIPLHHRSSHKTRLLWATTKYLLYVIMKYWLLLSVFVFVSHRHRQYHQHDPASASSPSATSLVDFILATHTQRILRRILLSLSLSLSLSLDRHSNWNPHPASLLYLFSLVSFFFHSRQFESSFFYFYLYFQQEGEIIQRRNTGTTSLLSRASN